MMSAEPSKVDPNWGRTLKASYDWVKLVKHLAIRLRETLSKTIWEYDGFLSQFSNMFRDIVHPELDDMTLEMKDLIATLDCLIAHCEQITSAVSWKQQSFIVLPTDPSLQLDVHLTTHRDEMVHQEHRLFLEAHVLRGKQLEEGILSRRMTERTSQETKVYNMMTMVSKISTCFCVLFADDGQMLAAVVVTASLFSMQSDPVPFLRRNSGPFLATVASVSAALFGIYLALSRWPRVWRRLKRRLGVATDSSMSDGVT
jgi:hypothetical protein